MQNPIQKVPSLCSYHTIILSDHKQIWELGPRNILLDHGFTSFVRKVLRLI